MATIYTYSLVTDFTSSNDINIYRFEKDLRHNSLMTTQLSNISVNGDLVNFTFVSPLSTTEESALDQMVTNHVIGSNVFDNKAILEDVKSVATNGGSLIADTWQTRTLNTVTGQNVDYWITLDNNAFTLEKGSYTIHGRVPAESVGNYQSRIFNLTTNAVEFYAVNSMPGFIGVLNVPSQPYSYILQQRCQYSRPNQGAGTSHGFGSPEIYATLIIAQSN
jgi:hypothetical protein